MGFCCGGRKSGRGVSDGSYLEEGTVWRRSKGTYQRLVRRGCEWNGVECVEECAGE